MILRFRKVFVDQTGVGEPVLEELKAQGVRNVEGLTFMHACYSFFTILFNHVVEVLLKIWVNGQIYTLRTKSGMEKEKEVRN